MKKNLLIQNTVIANTVPLSSGKLNFGDKVFVDESKSDTDYKTITLQNPFQFPNAAKYRVNTSFLLRATDSMNIKLISHYHRFPRSIQALKAITK